VRFYGIKRESLGQLGVIGRQIQSCQGGCVELKVEFVRPYCVAYMDLVMQGENRKRVLKLICTNPQVNRYLKQVGFEYLPKRARMASPFPQKDIIRINRFNGKPVDIESEVVAWLTDDVKPFLPEVTPRLWKKMVSNLWEVVHNGILHGESEAGVTAAGQFYPQKRYMEVAFYDAGHGIAKPVRAFLSKNDMSDAACITWATQLGNSTRPMKESAGLGLHLLREFLNLNGGVIQIVSGNGYYGAVANLPPDIQTLRNSIEGTLVNIRVNYDERLYRIKGENL